MVAVGKRAVDLDVDAKQFYEVLTQARLFDKKLYSGLRKNIRKAGEDTSKAMREEVKKAPGSAPVTTHRGLRTNLAAGIKVQIKATESARLVGAYIGSTGKSPASKLLKRAYDKPGGWRHPVFQKGQSAKGLKVARAWEKEHKEKSGKVAWTTQKGRPYFGSIGVKHEPEFKAAIEAALNSAVDTIAAG